MEEKKPEPQDRVYEFTSDLNISAIKNAEPETERFADSSDPLPAAPINLQDIPKPLQNLSRKPLSTVSATPAPNLPAAPSEKTSPAQLSAKERGLRTYEGDVAEALAHKNVSSATIAIAENEKREREKKAALEKEKQEKEIREKQEKERLERERNEAAEKEKQEKEKERSQKMALEQERVRRENEEKARQLGEQREREVREHEQREKERQIALARIEEQKKAAEEERQANELAKQIEETKKEALQQKVPPAPLSPTDGRVELGHFHDVPGLVQSPLTIATDQIPPKKVQASTRAERAASGETAGGSGRKKLFFLLLSMVFVLGGLIVAYYLYTMSPLSGVTGSPVPTSTHKALFAADSQATLAGTLSPEETFAKIKEEVARPQDPGTVREIIIDGTSGPQIMAKFGISVPDNLKRSITDQWMLGVYADPNGKKDVFVVLTNNFFQNAFAGMVSWENTMISDLKEFVFAEQNDFTLRGQFIDGIIGNKDVRAFLSEKGSIVLLYAFADNEKIVLTSQESTLREILFRLERQAYIR